jgi:hypothetical protein
MSRLLVLVILCTVTIGTAKAQQKPLFDTTFYLFSDQQYSTRFVIDDENGQYGDRKNAALIERKGGRVTLVDSLSVTDPIGAVVQRSNYNRDGIPDLLLFSNPDVRSNTQYYLYLVDTVTRAVHRVKEFEEIKNPEYDSVNDIIHSHVSSGTDYMLFYKITDHYKATDLGYDLKDDHTEAGEKRLERKLRQIYKKEGWKR